MFLCRYYGAAKNLPEVRAAMKKDPEEVHIFICIDFQLPRQSRYEKYGAISMDYYGFRDEEEGDLLNKEAEAEGRAIEEEVAAWEEREALKRGSTVHYFCLFPKCFKHE